MSSAFASHHITWLIDLQLASTEQDSQASFQFFMPRVSRLLHLRLVKQDGNLSFNFIIKLSFEEAKNSEVGGGEER